jgi:hypothetical protein
MVGTGMISKQLSLLGALLFCACLITGCAGTYRQASPPFPLCGGPTVKVRAVIAEVDSVDAFSGGGWFVFGRVLTTVYGSSPPRVQFDDELAKPGRFSGVYAAGPPIDFSVGDRVLAILADDGNPWLGREVQRMWFLRWLTGDPGNLTQAVLIQDPAAKMRRLQGWRPYQADLNRVVRDCIWKRDGRSLGELIGDIQDFYTNRRREYWTQWHYRDPWVPRKPVRWPESPPPVPGE